MSRKSTPSLMQRTGDCLEVYLAGEINAHTVDHLLTETEVDISAHISGIKLDMTEVRVVKPAGACFVASLMISLTARACADWRPLKLIRPNDGVVSYLATIGFFSLLASRARLYGNEDLLELEDRRRVKRRKKEINDTDILLLQKRQKSVVWPISILPQRTETFTWPDFENQCAKFLNMAQSKLTLVLGGDFGVAPGRESDFWRANYELYKNVFQHSKSWGFALVVARRHYGTVVCYQDLGIGFRGSVNESIIVDEYFEKDRDAVDWAMIDGNGSDTESRGEGLPRIKKAVLDANGLMEIRTGGCRTTISNLFPSGRHKDVPFLAGTQVSLFFPHHNSQENGTAGAHTKR